MGPERGLPAAVGREDALIDDAGELCCILLHVGCRAETQGKQEYTPPPPPTPHPDSHLHCVLLRPFPWPHFTGWDGEGETLGPGHLALVLARGVVVIRIWSMRAKAIAMVCGGGGGQFSFH